MSHKDELEIIVVDDPQDQSWIDKTKEEAKKLIKNPHVTKTIRHVQSFTKESLRKGEHFMRTNESVQHAIDVAKRTGDRTTDYIKQNETIQKSVKVIKESTMDGLNLVKESVEGFLSKPEIAKPIDQARKASADALEHSGKAVAEWIRPKDKSENEGE